MSILKDITISAYPEYNLRKDFNQRTNCVCAIYLHSLGKFSTSGIRKVIVQACNNETEVVFEDLIDVYRISMPFDYESFWSVSEYDQKKTLLIFLNKGIMSLCAHLGWEKELFSQSFNKLKNDPLDGIFDWGKVVTSPDRKHKAQVRYYYELDNVKLFARVWDNKIEESSVEYFLVETKPHEIRFVPFLGKLSWNGSDKLILYPKNKKNNPIEINLTSG